MKSRTRRAFSMSETLMTMGIIGLLAVTMLSMNNFSDNKQQIAQTKLTQVDSAIRAWGKAVTQMNETGVGATATISNAETLRASLMNTLNAKSIDPETGVITLDNGAEIKANYTLGDEQARESDSIFATGSALAHIEVSVPNADKNATPLSEDYILQVDKLSSMSDLLEGYTKVSVVEVNGEKRACFDNIAKCDITNEAGIHNCKTNPEQCELIDADLYDGNHIYIKNDTTASGCGINTTGSLITYTYITTNGSMYTYEKSTCCDTPKYYAGIDTFTGENICECVKANMTFVAGEYFDKYSNTCTATAPKGYYAIDGTSYPAMSDGGNIGYYCDETGLSAPKLCPAGYYCPKKTDNVAGATYGGDDIGSLINPVICPKGYYCPEGSQMPKECTEGHYCPTDGLGEPIACPRGTYQPTKGEITACSLCAPIIDGENKIPTYQDEVGQTSCKTCTDAGKFTEKTTGATSCTGCGAGNFYNSTLTTTNKCQKCPTGTYSVGNTDECTPCPAGTYQNKEGQTSCISCPAGTYQAQAGQASCPSCADGTVSPENATTCSACDCGEWSNYNHTVCIACKSNEYSNPATETKCTIVPENSTITEDKCAIICPAGYKFDAANNVCEACPGGTYSTGENSTECIPCTCGEWSNPQGTGCIACADNEYSNPEEGVACYPLDDNKIFGENKCSAIECTNGRVPNANNNACICNPETPKTKWNEATQQCVCPNTCPNDKIQQADCSCKSRCIAPKIWNNSKQQCECRNTCSGDQILDENCECKDPCPAYDKLYVIRYKGLSHNDEINLYQQLMGIQKSQSDEQEGKWSEVQGVKYVGTNAARSTSVAFKAIALSLSEKDKNKNFSKNYAYVIGVKYSPNNTLSESDLTLKTANNKYNEENKTVQIKNDNKAQNTKNVSDIIEKAEVIASFGPNTWYFKFSMDDVLEYEDSEEINNITSLDEVNSSIHNIKCEYYNSKGKLVNATNYNTCVNNNGRLIEITCKAESTINSYYNKAGGMRGYKYDTSSATCRSENKTTLEDIYASDNKYSITDITNITQANPDLHQVKNIIYYENASSNLGICKNHYDKKEQIVAGSVQCDSEANIKKRKSNAYFKPYNGSYLTCRANDGAETIKNINDAKDIDKFNASIHTFSNCKYKEGAKIITQKDINICKQKKTILTALSISCKAEKNMPVGYIQKYDKNKSTCRSDDTKSINDVTVKSADTNLHIMKNKCQFYTRNEHPKTTGVTSSRKTITAATNISTYITLVNDYGVTPTVTEPIICKSQANITKSLPNHFKNGYVYDNQNITCRSFNGTDTNSNYLNVNTMAGNSNMPCEKLCELDNMSGNAECINSCEKFKVQGTLFNNCQNSGYGSSVPEYCTGGEITISGCGRYNVAETYRRYTTPLILDLKDNGLEFTSIEEGVYFDLNGDGVIEKTAWTPIQNEFDDAFLWLDKNLNGKIDNGKELFGDQNGEENGFYELAKYDKNKDKVINNKDEIYKKLKLWVDMNSDGKIDNGEVKSLPEANVTEINLEFRVEYDKNGNIKTDKHGNITGFVGSFKQLIETIVDGVKTLIEKIGTMIDVFFATS